jgi:hypothetical protein
VTSNPGTKGSEKVPEIGRWVDVMVVGLCTMELLIADSNSLKDKRRVLKSMIDQVKAHHNVSIAEVGQLDIWQRSTIAFTCVSNEKRHTYQVLNGVIKFIEKQAQPQVLDYQIEMF